MPISEYVGARFKKSYLLLYTTKCIKPGICRLRKHYSFRKKILQNCLIAIFVLIRDEILILLKIANQPPTLARRRAVTIGRKREIQGPKCAQFCSLHISFELFVDFTYHNGPISRKASRRRVFIPPPLERQPPAQVYYQGTYVYHPTKFHFFPTFCE